jgi:CBS domain containing-hemolysin-like protein
MSLFTGAVILLLIFVNALYVAAEFAAVGVRHSRIRQRTDEGHALAIRLLPILSDPRMLDRYIAASQIGITISSLGLGAYGQATLARSLAPVFEQWGGLQDVAAHSIAATVVLIGLTVLQMILGELVPKSLALQYPTQTALSTVLPMQWSLRALSWFIAVLNGSGLAILKLMGVREAGHRHIHSPEEIELLIAESREGGLLEPVEHQRLSRALKLAIRPVKELMVPLPRVDAVEITMPFEDVFRRVTDSPYTRLPVYRTSLDQIVGLIHTKDIVMRSLDGTGPGSIDRLVRPVLTVPSTMTADQLLGVMRERHRQQAIVVDEHGGPVGLVTLNDVLGEVIGEGGDEFKKREAARG